jgi:hypothetical protein
MSLTCFWHLWRVIAISDPDLAGLVANVETPRKEADEPTAGA